MESGCQVSDNPADTFRLLIRRLQAEAADIGLELIQPAVMINPDDDGNDYLQAMFLIQPKAIEQAVEAKELTEEELEQKRQFDEMMAATERLELDQANEALRQETEGWLDG
jgi:hypothetical protein